MEASTQKGKRGNIKFLEDGVRPPGPSSSWVPVGMSLARPQPPLGWGTFDPPRARQRTHT